ncbi:hypothetical protein FEM48_Zijuj01G0248100 [Ziziphus jujuba var. spinosa]|uniref:Uncharacterized protein n=1 Tax=Ziziphus jujuba var. spinosa TaxID=714518 RepID=A0A978W4J9_ZIZJJ|nr:hypothetical protein FEM48_Zijuj01G0248100 [Ziziphus jujuba var. spinosa]
MPSISPSTFANLSSSLTTLSLSRCELEGEFPHAIIGLPNLQKLVLSKNHELTANFSKSSWSNSLQHVDISFTEISGHLPHLIGNVKSTPAFGYWKHQIEWVNSSLFGQSDRIELSESH